jgi:hypothetical protein
MVIDRSGTTRFFYYVRKHIARNWFSSLSLLDPEMQLGFVHIHNELLQCFDRGVEGRSGKSSSDSSSDDAAVLETIP